MFAFQKSKISVIQFINIVESWNRASYNIQKIELRLKFLGHIIYLFDGS